MRSIRIEGVVEGVEAEGRGESTKKVGGTMVSCYFGKMCRNAQCRFDHSEKHRFADSLKWRRSESSWKWASCCGVSGRRGEASGKTRACRFGPYCRHPYCRSDRSPLYHRNLLNCCLLQLSFLNSVLLSDLIILSHRQLRPPGQHPPQNLSRTGSFGRT